MQVWGGHTEEKEKWNSLSIMKKDGLGLYDGEETIVSDFFATWGLREVPGFAATEGHIWVSSGGPLC